MWFGRRDIIPPVSDLRTKLIDRGMLTQGLLSAEELAEMHRSASSRPISPTGWNTSRSRPASPPSRRSRPTGRRGRRSRNRRKPRPPSERSSTPGSSRLPQGERHQLRRQGCIGPPERPHSDVEKLAAAGLPVLHTPADLAAALGLTIPRLRWLCFHTEVATRIHYVQFEVPKKSGGTRTLSAPHRTLAAAQQWVLENILAKLPVEAAAHGFVPGRSTLTNAAAARRRACRRQPRPRRVLPAIGFPRVRHLFRRLGYSGAVATLLALLCTECPRQRVIYDGDALLRRHRPARPAAGRMHQSRALEPDRPQARPPSRRAGGETRADLHPLRRRPDVLRRHRIPGAGRLPDGSGPAHCEPTRASRSTGRKRGC